MAKPLSQYKPQMFLSPDKSGRRMVSSAVDEVNALADGWTPEGAPEAKPAAPKPDNK
jgi:hypothetical protein